MKLDFEYGEGVLSANLPDSTDVFIPGVTVPDPECLPQDWDTLYAETLKSIRNPIGMPTLTEMAHKGSKVVIVIPDIVKGGCQPTSHRKVSITACLEELYSAGVEKKDILLLISNGLHPGLQCGKRILFHDDLCRTKCCIASNCRWAAVVSFDCDCRRKDSRRSTRNALRSLWSVFAGAVRIL